MPDPKVETFPQQATTRKPTISELLAKYVTADEDFEEEVLHHYPDLDDDEINRLVMPALEKQAKERAFLDNLNTLLDINFSETPDATVQSALTELVAEGNEMAIKYLAFFNSPKTLENYRLLDLAVEEDPYWEKVGKGQYRSLPGAVHNSPNELLAAYKRNHGIN